MKDTYTAHGKTNRLVVRPKGDKFVVVAVDEAGYHLRFMFGKKFDTVEAAQEAIAAYCA